MIRLGSVAAALTFYYERMAAGDARALPLEPKEDAHTLWTPDPSRFHDVGLLVGMIGRLLRPDAWTDGTGRRHRPLITPAELRLIERVYRDREPGSDRLPRGDAERLAAVEARLAGPMIGHGILASDQLLDGLAAFREYVGASPKTLNRLTAKYPPRQLGGRKFQTLRRWVEDWIETLPRAYRRAWFTHGCLEPEV